MTLGKTEEKAKALSLSETINFKKYTLSRRRSLKIESMLTRDLAVKINFAYSRTEKFWLTREAKLHAINV